MNLKTSHVAIAGIALLALLNGENMRSFSEKAGATKTRKDTHKERLKLEKERVKDAGELSKIALDRFRSNCIMVIDAKTGKESYFQPGSPVNDTALNRPVREGAMVCNKLGDTAIVTNSAIENIASITAEDWQTFVAVLESRGFRATGQPTPSNQSKK